ncbi:MAG: dihydrofolate reductase family protein [Saprospiraceae bacterium]
MPKLSSFTFITLNGFYKGPQEDISWHRHGSEENETAEKGAQSESILLFGRVSYEMMIKYWPTPMAAKNDPVVADGMNRAEKIVFSRTLDHADWNNTRVVKDDMIETVRNLKAQGTKDMTLIGSGNVLAQLAAHDLIDTYQIMLDPVVIGQGTSLFQGLPDKLDLKLVDSKINASGVILLSYEPARF